MVGVGDEACPLHQPLYGRLAHERGDYQRASEVWQRAAAVNPHEYQATILLAQVYLAMQEPERARAWQERGLARSLQHLEDHPDDVRALYLSAVIQAQLGQRDQAILSAERVLALEPDDGVVAYNLACMYVALGEAEGLAAHARSVAIRMNPGSAD